MEIINLVLVINNEIRSEVYRTVSAQCLRSGFIKVAEDLVQPVEDSTERIKHFIQAQLQDPNVG